MVVSSTIANVICEEWFSKLDIDPKSEQCEIKCSTAEVNLGTFDCPLLCDQLCSSLSQSKSWIEVVLEFLGVANKYCQSEKGLMTAHPFEALQGFWVKINAEEITEKIIGRNKNKDESDAFRHCLGSSLLVAKLGYNKSENTLSVEHANQWLNAHESCATDRVASEMDYQNNKIGINLAVTLFHQNLLVEGVLIDQCLAKLKNGQLVVVDPLGYPNEIKGEKVK